MYIIVHRTENSEVKKVVEYLAKSLPNEINSNIEITKNWFTIGVNGTRIDFRSGDITKMRGSRPDYYNTDSCLASDYLLYEASRVHGKEIKDISDIINLIKEVADGQ